MIRDFFLGFIKIHVLYHATQEPIYGLDFIRELEEQGYLVSKKRVVEGKVRKYYSATRLGEDALVEAYTKARELIDEISNIETRSID